MHLLTSGDNQHRRHYLTKGRYMLLSLADIFFRRVGITGLPGMERLLPRQPGNCAISQPDENISTLYLAQRFFEAIRIKR